MFFCKDEMFANRKNRSTNGIPNQVRVTDAKKAKTNEKMLRRGRKTFQLSNIYNSNRRHGWKFQHLT